MSVIKSSGAIVAGFITVVVLSIGTDSVLEATGVFTPPGQGFFAPWMLWVALVYRCIYTVAGGYVTAWLAPNRVIRHVTILGIIGVVAGTIGVVVGWNLSEHWYPIAIAITAFPCTWFGGKLRVMRSMTGLQQVGAKEQP